MGGTGYIYIKLQRAGNVSIWMTKPSCESQIIPYIYSQVKQILVFSVSIVLKSTAFPYLKMP